MLFRIKLGPVPLRVEELAIHVQTLSAFVIEYLTQTNVRSIIRCMDIIPIRIARAVTQQVIGAVAHTA